MTMNGEEEKTLLAQFEQEIDIDAATLEQYVTMPFNYQLHALLEKESPTTIITTVPVKRSLEATTPDEAAISFHAQGMAQFHPQTIEMDVVVRPAIEEGYPFHITNSPTNKDEFIVNQESEEGNFIEVLSKEQLFVLFASLVHKDGQALLKARDALPEEVRSNPKYLHDLIEQFWMELGEQSGHKYTVTTLEKDISTTTQPYREYLRLTYEEEETLNESLAHLTLENRKEFDALDARDLHKLRITVSSNDITRFDQEAQRHVQSGTGESLTANQSTGQESGRITSLDLNNPLVIKQFVDWFNQLIAA